MGFHGAGHTSHAGAVTRVHGGHGLGGAGRAAHAGLVYSADSEGVGTPLDQTGHGEAGKLDGGVIALAPVGSANLTSEKEGQKQRGWMCQPSANLWLISTNQRIASNSCQRAN